MTTAPKKKFSPLSPNLQKFSDGIKLPSRGKSFSSDSENADTDSNKRKDEKKIAKLKARIRELIEELEEKLAELAEYDDEELGKDKGVKTKEDEFSPLPPNLRAFARNIKLPGKR